MICFQPMIRWSCWLAFVGLLICGTPGPARAAQEIPAAPLVVGRVFEDNPRALYASLREVGNALGLKVHWDAPSGVVYLQDAVVPEQYLRQLPDGQRLILVSALAEWGATVAPSVAKDTMRVTVGRRGILIGEQRLVEPEPADPAVDPEDEAVLEGVTFAATPGALYVPIRPLAKALKWWVRWDVGAQTMLIGQKRLPKEALRALADGSYVARLDALAPWGASTSADAGGDLTRVQDADGDRVWVRPGEQRITINRRAQRLRAWQGELLVLDTNVSTGAPGMETPTGQFNAGPIKAPMLISRKYGNAKMPWSVQVQGNILIHGSTSVPPRGASHGCIRMPLTGSNPARRLYDWVEIGTPITIADGWPEER